MIPLRIRPLTGKTKLFTNNVHTEVEEGDSRGQEMNLRKSTKIKTFFCNFEQNNYTNVQGNDCINEKEQNFFKTRMTT